MKCPLFEIIFSGHVMYGQIKWNLFKFLQNQASFTKTKTSWEDDVQSGKVVDKCCKTTSQDAAS